MASGSILQTDDQWRESFTARCDRIAGADDFLRIFAPGGYDREQVLNGLNRLLERFPNPVSRPPLFGLSVGIKDIFHCDGFVTRCGSALPPSLFQGAEADTVTRLKAAGAVVMGKSATTEFAFFAPAPTRNPVNPDHTPGGSSSGSAAGVAAGFFDIALGTQTIGSMIRPAAYCGVVGFKPSLGRFSTRGVVPLSPTADHVGVFCRSASALPPVLKVLDEHPWRPDEPPQPIRIGVPRGPYLNQADAAALSAFAGQVNRLEDAGCTIVTLPVLDDILKINERHTQLAAGEMARVHAPWFEDQRRRYHPTTIELIETGMAVSEERLGDLRLSGLWLRSALTDLMDRNRLTAWACPAAMGEAPKGLDATGSPLMNLPWTHAGLPAVTLPAGTGPAGLPLGLQLVGRFMADEQLAALANRAEAILAEPV
jgi:Asp-tRNA(Asn)/Glu-tRNA(Gln) amidotransferase A subunit family amidase